MLIAFRAWRPLMFSDGTPILKSFIADYYWEGPVSEGSKPSDVVNEANSYSYKRDEKFGFFSYTKFESLSNMLHEEDLEDSISGVVQPFGLVQHHRNGYRSQRAQMIALCDRVKCALARCDNSVETWIVHENKIGITGVCSDHLGIMNASWMKSQCGDNPEYIDHSKYLSDLALRYHCDIVNYDELKNFKENYGSR
jgi:hypothetical protein